MSPKFDESFSTSTNELQYAIKVAGRMKYPIYLLPDFGIGKVKGVKVRSEWELEEIYPDLLAQSEMNQVTIKKPIFVLERLSCFLSNWFCLSPTKQ